MKAKRVADYLTKKVVSISSESSVWDAILSMKKNSIGSVLVKEGDKPVGIFTERDLLTKVYCERTKDLTSIKIKDVMSTDLKIVNYDETYTNVIELMQKYHIRHMPVAKEGEIIGMVSLRDLLDHYYENLEHLLKETVSALSSAVEKRDPYTAGHQRRVTQLACAISEELSLPKKQISGISMASIIHDIGKLYVPAEILSKPCRLNEAELTLIKIHPQVGYDILKSIEFPWPVAQAVLQHHERLNGSGYPQGLKGEMIILEARVIAVADVIEAMASHRPYRPAIGIDKAMEEIYQKKGELYDPAIVDACLRIFEKKKFVFK